MSKNVKYFFIYASTMDFPYSIRCYPCFEPVGFVSFCFCLDKMICLLYQNLTLKFISAIMLLLLMMLVCAMNIDKDQSFASAFFFIILIWFYTKSFHEVPPCTGIMGHCST